jgi:hypothetical protein
MGLDEANIEPVEEEVVDDASMVEAEVADDVGLDMEPVVSSNIGEIGYDFDESTLYVRFLNGSLYRYSDVPPDIWDSFRVAPSKGKYLHREVKVPGYAYERLE